MKNNHVRNVFISEPKKFSDFWGQENPKFSGSKNCNQFFGPKNASFFWHPKNLWFFWFFKFIQVELS